MKLTDLNTTGWTPIARRVQQEIHDVWLWSITPEERGVFYMAREMGTLLTAQTRGDDGVMRLVARLATNPPPLRDARIGSAGRTRG